MTDVYYRIAPVMTGVAPASLIVQQSLFVVNTTCPAIKTLDFTPEKTNDWRKTAKLSGGIKLPLSWWNATCDPFEPSNSDCFDYYTSPSSFLETVSKFAAYSKKPISRENAALNTCGLGWNCSFTIDFTAPGYQCSEDVELSGMNIGFLTIVEFYLSLQYHTLQNCEHSKCIVYTITQLHLAILHPSLVFACC
jgi:hypothetical protein